MLLIEYVLISLTFLSLYQKTIQPVVSIIDSGLVPEETRFIGLQHVPDVELVCIAASTGEVLTFSTITNQVKFSIFTKPTLCMNNGVCLLTAAGMCRHS